MKFDNYWTIYNIDRNQGLTLDLGDCLAMPLFDTEKEAFKYIANSRFDTDDALKPMSCEHITRDGE